MNYSEPEMIIPSRYTYIPMNLKSFYYNNPKFYLDLHPGRFENVKQRMNFGETHMLHVYYSQKKIVFDDGRHRLIALLKMGHEKALFVLLKNDIDYFKDYID